MALKEGRISEKIEEASHIKLVDVQNSQILHSQIIIYEYKAQESLADYLHILHVDKLICNEIPEYDIQGLGEIGISLQKQIEDNMEENINSYLKS